MTSDVGVEPVLPGESSGADGLEKRADLLAHELAERWRLGERPRVEEYLDRHPELCEHPIAATRLIYEEFCQRRERGESPARSEYFDRFPAWRDSLDILFECEQLVEQEAAGPRYPLPGQDYAGLELLQELGRGAASRVYLAAQSNLGNRPVVLKLTRLDGIEHLSLARLQHTHIVPLYWSEDDRDRGLRILCMPYLGGMTLARLLSSLKPLAPERRTGKAILAQIDHEPMLAPIPGLKRGAGRKFLEKASGAQAWCGIAICLAEALHEAHEAGLVHLDLKPSNVLMAADGKPLLLDFHLAREPLLPSGTTVPSIGGTPQYMSPEQVLAFERIRQGERPGVRVDHRSDIYSLGLLLREMLAMDAAKIDSDLRSIIDCCLQEKPEERYGSAIEFASDLKRHMEGRPPVNSRWSGMAARAVKSIVRNRQRLVLGLCFAAAVLAAVWIALRATDERLISQRVATLLDTAENQISRGESSPAAANLSMAETLSHGMWLVSPDGQRLASLSQQEDTLRDADRLHHFADEVRLQVGANPVDDRVRSQCAFQINESGQLLNAVRGRSSGWARNSVRDVIELAFIGQSGGSRKPLIDTEGLNLRVPEETALVAALFAHPQESETWTTSPPHGAFDYYLRGRAWCQLGNLDRAARDFEQAASLEPAWPWPAYCLGQCNFLRERWADAVGNFTVAMSLIPERTEIRIARGKAYQRAGDLSRALGDYEQALVQCPESGEAAFGRGTVNYALGRYPEAIHDFQRARAGGADAAKTNYNLALCHVANHDNGRARESVREALKKNPAHEPSRLLERKLLGEKAP